MMTDTIAVLKLGMTSTVRVLNASIEAVSSRFTSPVVRTKELGRLAKTALWLALVALPATVALGQGTQAPECDSTCNGGDQPPNSAGAAIQTWTSLRNQRGLGGPTVSSQAAGTSKMVEGSQSYTYSVPLFNIPGRGLSLNLTLYYNSLLWQLNSENNSMVYAADFEMPSPGFILGYGAIDFSTDLGVGFITEPTGAKHLLVPTTFPQYRTTDSSYIQVLYPSTTGGSVVATFKNGLKIYYQPFTVLVNSRTEYRPYQIEDSNGNYISVTYADPNDLNISTISDTVGRVVQFTYDSTGKMLQSVSQLNSSGQALRTYTFGWTQGTLSFNFTLQATAGLGLAPGYYTSGQSKVNLLSQVTRPDGTSVTFDYGFGTGGNPDWGVAKTITELSSTGAVRASTTYVFPPASAGALTANPTYTQQIVFDGVHTGTWNYLATLNANGALTTLVATDPCGTVKTTTYSAAGDALDGLPISEQITNIQPASPGCPTSAAQTWGTVSKTWTTDSDGSNARLLTVTRILEDGTTQSQVKFNGYDSFGQVTDLLEYDFGAGGPGALLRETVTTYAPAMSGVANHASRVVVKAGNGTVASRTDFNYDEVAVADLPSNPVNHDSAYTSAITARFNLTSLIRYANAAGGAGGITSKFTYDAAGNRLTTQDGCCTFTQKKFSSTTNYAFPDSVQTGPAGNALSLTTNSTYNLATGTVASTADANGQVTSYGYDVDDRLISTKRPDNSVISQSFDDSSASPGVTVSNSLNSRVQVTTVDGRGRTISQQTKNGATLLSTTTTTNDLVGRPISVSNPFGPSDSPLYTTYQYDPVDRVIQLVPPGNTGSYQSSYSLQTVTITDPAGKQRRNFADAFGHLRQIDEPGPSGGAAGSGSVSISGTEQSVSVQNGGGASAGTGSVTVSGTERSTVVLTHAATQASVTVTVGGAEVNNNHSVTTCTGGPPSRLPPTCHTISSNPPDTGTMAFSVTVSGTTFGPYSVSYGASSTTSSLAAALAGAFPANGLVTLSYGGGSSFTLTTTAASSAMNSSTLSTSVATSCVPSYIDNGTGGSSSTNCNGPGWTITPSQNFAGGSDNVNTTFYDAGTVSMNVTINGTVYSKSSSYGQSTTSAGIASDLANKINADTTLNKLLIAGSAGSVLNLTTTATGNGTNDPLSVSSATNSQYFSSGSTSFPATPSGSTLTPGQNGTIYDAGTVTVSITGFTEAPFKKTVSYSQGSTASAIASSIAGAFNSDPLSPVTATASSGSIALTANTLGSETNYGAQVSSATTQTSYFSQPSFSGSAVSLSGGANPSVSLQTALSTFYTYDVSGHLLQSTQGQQTRTYTYDSLGRMTSSTIPETGNLATQLTYTDWGAVAQRTDPRGIVTTFGYDAIDRLNQITYSDSALVITYAYGAAGAGNFSAGRLIQLTDASGSQALSYDQMGRTTQIARTIGSQTYKNAYGYTNGVLSSITYPSGRVVTIAPDAIGRFSQVSTNGSNLLTVNSYNAANRVLAATYGNGFQTAYTYNSQMQLASLASGMSGTNALSLTYNYGSQDNGQIQGITDNVNPSQSTSYVYDELGRLKFAQTNDLSSPSTWKLEFRHDRYGNLLGEIPEGGTANMPFSEIAVDPTTNHIVGVQYDASGNVTNDGMHTYSRNEENQVTQVDGAGSMVYDANGLRVIKNGTVYIYDGNHVIAEYASGAAPSSPSVEYLYAGGSLVASVAGTSTTYYYADHLSNRVLANASGAVVGTLSRFPFGEIQSQTGNSTKWQFTNYERDLAPGDSGLDYALARFYGSNSGRFTSIDPLLGNLSNPQSLNRFVYALDDPINLSDPTGMFSGNFLCLLNDFGDCVGGDYAGSGLSIMNPLGMWADPLDAMFPPLPSIADWGKDQLAEGEARYDSIIHSWGSFDPATGTYLAEIAVVGFYTTPDGDQGLVMTEGMSGLTKDQLTEYDSEMQTLVNGLSDGSIVLGIQAFNFVDPQCNLCREPVQHAPSQADPPKTEAPKQLSNCEIMEKQGTVMAAAGGVMEVVGLAADAGIITLPAGISMHAAGAAAGLAGGIWAGIGALGNLMGVCQP